MPQPTGLPLRLSLTLQTRAVPAKQAAAPAASARQATVPVVAAPVSAPGGAARPAPIPTRLPQVPIHLGIAGAGAALRPVDVVLNGAPVGSWTLLEVQSELFAPADAFAEWRLGRPTRTVIEYRGQTWHSLAAVPGYDARIDAATQTLDLKFSAEAYTATLLGAPSEQRPPNDPSIHAAYFNYDLTYSRVRSQITDSTTELGALAELGATGPYGVFSSSFVGRNVLASPTGSPRSWRRLETTFSRDFPERNITLKVGDTATRSGLTGRTFYFGGVQLARNFGLTPGLVTQPIPVLAGTSNAPSTVELYINDALRQTSNVQPGPFTINNPPTVSGAGEARVVVRDLLGRETVLVQPFFTHAELLEQGLSDWSVDAGAIRRDLGNTNADYGDRFAAGLLRLGLTKTLTMEARAEVSPGMRQWGLAAITPLPGGILSQTTLLTSQSEAGRGRKWSFDVERQAGDHGFAGRIERTGTGYRVLGGSNEDTQRQQLTASYSYGSTRWGNFGFSAASIQSYNADRIRSYGATYSMQVGQRGSLSVNLSRYQGATSGTSVGLSLVTPLDGGRNVSGNVTTRPGNIDAYASVTQAAPQAGETGWRLLGGQRSGATFAEGGLYRQAEPAALSLDVSAASAQQALRLAAQGGMVLAGGKVFATRSVRESFALVEVPGYAGVGVGFQGAKMAHTDSQGRALITGLQPNTINRIQLDPSELPISAEIDSIEQVAVPAARSGVLVKFPIRSGRGALIRLVLDDGEAAPAGAEIAIEGDNRDFYVARRGEAFVTGLQTQNRLRLKWKERTCLVDVTLPPGNPDEIPRIGPLTCKGLQR